MADNATLARGGRLSETWSYDDGSTTFLRFTPTFFHLTPSYLQRLLVTVPLLQAAAGREYVWGQQNLFRT